MIYFTHRIFTNRSLGARIMPTKIKSFQWRLPLSLMLMVVSTLFIFWSDFLGGYIVNIPVDPHIPQVNIGQYYLSRDVASHVFLSIFLFGLCLAPLSLLLIASSIKYTIALTRDNLKHNTVLSSVAVLLIVTAWTIGSLEQVPHTVDTSKVSVAGQTLIVNQAVLETTQNTIVYIAMYLFCLFPAAGLLVTAARNDATLQQCFRALDAANEKLKQHQKQFG